MQGESELVRGMQASGTAVAHMRTHGADCATRAGTPAPGVVLWLQPTATVHERSLSRDDSERDSLLHCDYAWPQAQPARLAQSDMQI